MTLLDFARAQHYATGSNLKGAPSRPLWWFLRPDLASPVLDPGTGDPVDAVAVGPIGAHQRRRDRLDVWHLAPGAEPPPAAESSGPALVVLSGAPATTSVGRRVARRLSRRLQRGIVTAADATILALRPGPGDGAEGRTAMALPGGVDPTALPAYLREVASLAGTDLADYRWTVIPPRGYLQQKVVFLAHAPDPDLPDIAIKVTQDASFNVRLANEQDALERHWPAMDLTHGTLPRPLFRGETSSLLVAGASAVAGVPFRQVCDGSPDHPLVDASVTWLHALASSAPARVASEDISAAFGDLVARFLAMYGAPDLADVLHGLVETAAAGLTCGVPTHGDPGTWNLLVTRDDRVAFLDWENAEAVGVPLWDLALYVQALGSWAAQRAGRRYGPPVYRRQVLEDSPYRALLRRAVRVQCNDLGIDDVTAGALFHLGWAFQALKEGTRLPAKRLARSRTLAFLQMGLRATGGRLP